MIRHQQFDQRLARLLHFFRIRADHHSGLGWAHAGRGENPGSHIDDANAARYGLAMEYVKGSQLQEAVEEFRVLLAANANYPAAYFHGGQALEKLGQLDEARALYEKGIAVTTAMGDLHTRSELQGALEQLG